MRDKRASCYLTWGLSDNLCIECPISLNFRLGLWIISVICERPLKATQNYFDGSLATVTQMDKFSNDCAEIVQFLVHQVL